MNTIGSKILDRQIESLLNKVESEYGVTIILAVESGSRAWGFPSRDSDYDIRFIYVHERDWYASVFPKRDVIENMFVGELDAGGWDLRKALQLMQKGNAPLYEWLGSPIVYRRDMARLPPLAELAAVSVNPKALFYHYFSLAKKKIAAEDFATNAKSFLYGFRALLCAQWIVDFGSAPPVAFRQLVDRYLAGEPKVVLGKLLDMKRDGGEGDIQSIDGSLIKLARALYTDVEVADVEVLDLPPKSAYEEAFARILEA